MLKQEFINCIKKQLIISCQAVDNEPLNDVHTITLMAKAVIEGGAKILRLSQYEHIESIVRTFKTIPIIGLIKKKYLDSEVFITPTINEINQLIKLGANCIALDCTSRTRPKETLDELISYIQKQAPEIAIMGDCATIEDIQYCEKLGVDLVSTTLHGYTEETKNKNNIDNDYAFIKQCLQISQIPVIAEGGIWEPHQVKDLLNLGCYSVVVGSAITRPKEITKRFYRALGGKD